MFNLKTNLVKELSEPISEVGPGFYCHIESLMDNMHHAQARGGCIIIVTRRELSLKCKLSPVW